MPLILMDTNLLVYLYDHREVLFAMTRRIRADWLRHVEQRPDKWVHMFDSVLQG